MFWLLGISFIVFFMKMVHPVILKLILINFIIYFTFKLHILIDIILQNSPTIFRNVLHILLRILLIPLFYCFTFFANCIVLMYFVNLLHVFRKTGNLLYVSLLLSVIFNDGKYIIYTICLESSITSHESWVIFSLAISFLVPWFK